MDDIIHLGSFAKRKNSTKQPGSLSDSRTIKLKQPTSVTNPVFILSGDLFDYNYCKWDNKYYFITDAVSVHDDMTEIHCELDPLATYKSEILNTTAYILYDSTPNTELIDNRLPLKTTKTVSANSAAFPWNPVQGGCYILSITGHGSTGVYKLNDSELAGLIDDISDIMDNFFPQTTPPDPDDYPNTITGMMKYWGDTMQFLGERVKHAVSAFFGSGDIPQNIRGCIYLPFNIGVSGGATAVNLGVFPCSQTLRPLISDTVQDSVTVSIPWQSSDFRRRSPYTDIYLYLPYIGMTKLSSENLAGQTSITVDYTIAIKSGGLICTVKSGAQILGQYSGNVAVSVPIGLSSVSLPKVAGTVIAGAVAAGSLGSAIAAGTGAGAAGAGLAMSALNFNESITPNFSTIGGLDGSAAIATNQNVVCYTVYHDTIVPPNQNLPVIGSPSMCSKLIGSLSGFCQCADAHVEAAAEGPELELIDSYLNSGFFIE